MKVLVIGTRGQLARSLSEAASARQLPIRLIGRPDLDLSDVHGVRTAITAAQPGVVINAAAYTAVDRAESDAIAAFAVNAAAPEAMAQACEDLGVPFVHISTDYVFDGTKDAPYVEDDPAAPLGIYGRSKLDGEQRVAAACARHLILRTAWVYSPFGSNFVRTMLRLAEARSEIAVVDDQVGNPTYAPHLASAILTLTERLMDDCDVPWGLYHLAGSGEATWCDLAREVLAVSSQLGGPTASVRAITTAEYPTAARRPANSRLDCSRARRLLGIGLPHWQEGVAQCVARLLPDVCAERAE